MLEKNRTKLTPTFFVIHNNNTNIVLWHRKINSRSMVIYKLNYIVSLYMTLDNKWISYKNVRVPTTMNKRLPTIRLQSINFRTREKNKKVCLKTFFCWDFPFGKYNTYHPIP